jgi:hypothetical protein
LLSAFQVRAARAQRQQQKCNRRSKEIPAGHKDAHSNACPSAFNPKDLDQLPPKIAGLRRLFLPTRAESDSLSGRGFPMNHRLFAILIVVCLALAGGGCASEALRKKNEEEVLLPRQTGSLISRRMNQEPDKSHKPKKKKKPDPKHPEKKTDKKTAKTEKTEPEKAKEPKPDQPEETTAPPDRFR